MIIPGHTYYGKPVKKIKKNLIGLKRNKISDIILKNENKRFQDLLMIVKNAK